MGADIIVNLTIAYFIVIAIVVLITLMVIVIIYSISGSLFKVALTLLQLFLAQAVSAQGAGALLDVVHSWEARPPLAGAPPRADPAP